MPAATAADVRPAERIMLYGVTGSGKSTGAQLLGAPLGLPVHLVDEEIGWLPGWVMRTVEEQRAITARLVAGERWVMDTAYGSFRDLVLARAQVVVALDYPRRVSFGRLLRRTGSRWVTQEQMCNGNTERLRQILSPRDSILLWHARSYPATTRRIRAWESAPDGIPVLRLSHPRELGELLAALGPARPQPALPGPPLTGVP